MDNAGLASPETKANQSVQKVEPLANGTFEMEVSPMKVSAPKKKSIQMDDSDDEASESSAPIAPRRKVTSTLNHYDSDDEATDPNQSSSEDGSEDEGSSSEYAESEDVPLSKKMLKRKKPAKMVNEEESVLSSEDDAPLSQRIKVRAKAVDSDEEGSFSDDDKPLAKRMPASKRAVKSETPSQEKKAPKAPKKKAKRRMSSDSDNDDEEVKQAIPKKKKATKSAETKVIAGTEKSSVKKEGSPKKKKEEEEVDIYRWWEQEDRDDSIKWNTLEHNGVLFPPSYEPHGVKMKYEGKEVDLSPESEEVAGFFAQLVGTQYAENPTFCENFFEDFTEILRKYDPGCPIKEFEKCDFTPMTDHFAQARELKKAMTKEMKDELKAAKKAIEEQYGFAIIDGRKEKVGNFRIEPPGLFRGRGDHPKTGKLKRRVMPEQVTINIGKGAKVPTPPAGHQWGGVIHDNTVAWLATWTENINSNTKYVLFAAGSSLKGMSDFKKFEKARELKQHIGRIRETYMSELKDKLMATRQRATSMWLIDKLALRAGNEKGEDEADTVGCCSLRYEHITLEEDSEDITDPENPGQVITISKKMVVFDFLGKDSIRYYNRVEVDPVVWKNLKIFKKEPKKEGDPIFDRLTTQILNKHLTSLMAGLTAKVFRTFNASYTFQEELKKTRKDDTVAEKVLAYNRANRQVAILCNHQRTVSKGHGTQMQRITNKLLNLKYQLHMVRQKLLELDPKLKKKMPELAEELSDMDEDAVEEEKKKHEEQELLKLEKKYEKMCAKAEADGKPKPDKPKLSDTQREPNEDRLLKQNESLKIKIMQTKTMRTDKDENKTTALGTSKINYIDPRITTAWCNKYEVPLEKMFNRSLREKFKWAMEVDADWTF